MKQGLHSVEEEEKKGVSHSSRSKSKDNHLKSSHKKSMGAMSEWTIDNNPELFMCDEFSGFTSSV